MTASVLIPNLVILVVVLISDLGGSADALETVLAAGPDVLNHNVETVARLQRAVRPNSCRRMGLSARHCRRSHPRAPSSRQP